MNKFIREQLEKSNLNFQQEGDIIYIPRQELPKPIQIQKSGYYIFLLADYILHPGEHFDLQDKWNNGMIPKSKYIKCQVKTVMGKMLQVDGCGYDLLNDEDRVNELYYGLWLPLGGIQVIKEI